MCKCKEKYDLVYIRNLATKISIFDKKDVAIYKLSDSSYNFGELEFVQFIEYEIIEIIYYTD